MSPINIFNYEGYYLELIEGTISIENKALLLDFLSKNPNLVEPEFEYALPSFNADTTPEFKESLKIHDEAEIISENNIEWFIWAKMEGILSSQSIVRLKRYLDDQPSLYRLVVDFQETILPSERFIFTNKKSLKQGKKVALWPIISTVAAAILAFILIGEAFIFNPKAPVTRETSSIETNDSNEPTNLVESIIESTSTPVADITTIGVINSKVEKTTSKNQTPVKKTIVPETIEPKELAIESPSNELAEVTPEIKETLIPENNDTEVKAETNPELEKITEVETTPATNSLAPSSNNKRKFKFRIGKFGVTKK